MKLIASTSGRRDGGPQPASSEHNGDLKVVIWYWRRKEVMKENNGTDQALAVILGFHCSGRVNRPLSGYNAEEVWMAIL
jgi:hypothetical protein